MKPLKKCPVCGGELEDKQVEKLLRGGGNTVSMKVTAEVCLHCGERLYAEEVVKSFEEIRGKLRKQEKCGKMGISIVKVVNERVTATDDRVTQSRNDKTNRSVKLVDSKNPTDLLKLHDLIVSYIEKSQKDLGLYFEDLVKEFNTNLNLKSNTFYRAVPITAKSKLESSQIGPSPNPKDGRYNYESESCLYLTDNIDSLPRELNSKRLLCQKYEIPINRYKIADLSTSKKNSYNNNLALAFEMTESGKIGAGYNFEEQLKNKGKSRYTISQLLSSYFKIYDWEGLLIPGVHGGNGYHYHNLVIFSTVISHWKEWAAGDYFSKCFK